MTGDSILIETSCILPTLVRRGWLRQALGSAVSPRAAGARLSHPREGGGWRGCVQKFGRQQRDAVLGVAAGTVGKD